jgi:hypothetical protein
VDPFEFDLSRPVPQWSFVIPAKNEAETIVSTIDALTAWSSTRGESIEVIVVINGSTDDTEQMVSALLPTHRDVSMLRSAAGLGIALRRGIAASTGHFIVALGADMSFGTSDIDRWDRTTCAVGSKAHPQSSLDRPLGRSVLTMGFRLLRNVLVPLPIVDTQGSLLLLGDVGRWAASITQLSGFGMSAELLAVLHDSGQPIVEIPITMKPRVGRSNVRPFRHSVDTVRELTKIHRARRSWSHLVGPARLVDANGWVGSTVSTSTTIA